ncbi:MAG TPA: tetratricopeptide repeat protein [Gemmataceae bacterium]|nr:tetratricopeptide repeat protein [Gemmataceae bacterium]
MGFSNYFSEAQKHHQAQNYAEAESLYRCAVDEEPNHVGAWHHLGLTCAAQDKLSDAASAFQKALNRAPQHVDTLTQLGIVYARQNRLQDAIARFRQAVEIKPDHAKAHNNLGVALTQFGRPEEGTACYREAVRLQPDYAEAHFNLGVSLADRRQHDEAILCYECALHARPDYVDALYNLGLLLVHERRSGEAVILLQHAVRLRPENSEAHNNLSLAYADLGRFEDAVASCDAALRLRPLDAKTHMNRGNALGALGRLDEALASYALAIRLQPDYVNARWNRSLAWLALGNFERGWPEYEWRWQRAEAKTRNFPEPKWDGGPLDGKTILLWSEQGLGDALQFVRYASELKRCGATVWVECPAKMIPLLSRVAGVDRVLPEGAPLPAGFDYQAPLMSLPLFCKTTLADVPAAVPYLSLDPAEVEKWRKELQPSRAFKIGVAWQGNPKHRFDQHRSFSPQWFRTLAMIDGVEIYSLQKGAGTDQLAGVRFPFIELGSRLDESGAFLDTAAVMQGLDLVITCDSALAHLAGALGVPVWVALSHTADWRWLLHREDSLWYPTMRLFRQKKLGDWGPVFEHMREEIKLLRKPTSGIQLEVAPGELLDKLTILQIKSERIADPEKLRNVRSELAVVDETRDRCIGNVAGLPDLVGELKGVNERLWDIENRIRQCEQAQDFSDAFVALARSVYQTNDRRAEIKKQINTLLGAAFREEKDYRG